jgi:hypothetical protein
VPNTGSTVSSMTVGGDFSIFMKRDYNLCVESIIFTDRIRAFYAGVGTNSVLFILKKSCYLRV